MRIHLRKVDLLVISVASLITLLLGIIGWRVLGPKAIVVSLSAAVFLILLVQFQTYRGQTAFLEQQTMFSLLPRQLDYKQIEAMLSLLSIVKLKRPLPPMRGWAVSPDHANIIISAILDRKPKVILECGCGVSTILMSYCVKDRGEGHIWSIDHDEGYAKATRENLKSHQLEDVATIIHAPLKEVSIKGESRLWYDPACTEEIGAIDLLVVDGPPRKIQELIRYPALPLLIGRLSENAVIILDDASREDEKKTVEAWLDEFKDLKYEWHDTEKGTAVLIRGNRAACGPA